jgi:hypothetical protein
MPAMHRLLTAGSRDTAVVLAGKMDHRVQDTSTGQWIRIPEPERIFLEFRIHPDKGIGPTASLPGAARPSFTSLPICQPQMSSAWLPAPKQLMTATGEKRGF